MEKPSFQESLRDNTFSHCDEVEIWSDFHLHIGWQTRAPTHLTTFPFHDTHVWDAELHSRVRAPETKMTFAPWYEWFCWFHYDDGDSRLDMEEYLQLCPISQIFTDSAWLCCVMSTLVWMVSAWLIFLSMSEGWGWGRMHVKQLYVLYRRDLSERKWSISCNIIVTYCTYSWLSKEDIACKVILFKVRLKTDILSQLGSFLVLQKRSTLNLHINSLSSLQDSSSSFAKVIGGMSPHLWLKWKTFQGIHGVTDIVFGPCRKRSYSHRRNRCPAVQASRTSDRWDEHPCPIRSSCAQFNTEKKKGL